jgi:ubiquinone/menaquinone biosynthesis C-methylase UbiE
MKYKKQVDTSHYSFERYFYKGRWMSYWYQAKEIISRPEILTVLDVGPGTVFLKSILTIHRPDISYSSIDVAADVKPDIVGGVTRMPIPDNAYDVVCAFQVLEHIEFDDFEIAVAEMKRVSKKYVFISLPHFGPSIELQFKMPFLPRIQRAVKIPFPKVHLFGGQHYWEIGKKGYSAQKIRSILQKHLTLIDEYVPFENQYHRFFILRIPNEIDATTDNKSDLLK